MRRYNNRIPEQDSGTFNLSISDLMAGLLAIFILALSYFILNFSQNTAKLTQNNIVREELVTSLRDDIVQMGIKVDVDEKRGILRIPEKALFFRVGHAEVDDPATVRKIGAVLLKTLKRKEYEGKIETVFIEGHTDSDPTGAGSIYASNWELSTQRAINTWNVMKSGDNKELAELKNNVVFLNKEGQKEYMHEYVFSCSGYGETRPIAPNDAMHKSQNRRIDIRFTMVPPVGDDSNIVKSVREGMLKNEK